MGYCMEQVTAEFSMKRDNMPKALKALQEIPENEFDYLIASKGDILACETFIEAMSMLDWKLDFDGNQNVCGILFMGNKAHNDFQVMTAIAPYVKNDSYIKMMGEDNSIWVWEFEGEKCYEV